MVGEWGGYIDVPQSIPSIVIDDKCSVTLPLIQMGLAAKQMFRYRSILSGKNVISDRPE